MQRQRGELVPIGDALADLGGPVKAIREASPQARHHFTRFDQVNQLVSASESDPDLGFMARTMALCSLPRTNPGNRSKYVRRNGPYRGTAQIAAKISFKLLDQRRDASSLNDASLLASLSTATLAWPGWP